MQRVEPSRVGANLSIAALLAGAMVSGLSFLSTPKDRRGAPSGRSRGRRGAGDGIPGSRLGGINPPKINFRRSDPRHPMYDALRAKGWQLETELAAVGPNSHDGNDEPLPWIELSSAPVVVCRHEKQPLTMLAREAFRFERLPVPKCLRVLR